MERFMADSLNNIMRQKEKKQVRLSIIIFVIFFIACGYYVQAQSVYVPVQHEVYDFLKRMEARQLLDGLSRCC